MSDIFWLILFFLGLGIYLVWSAKTEMGTTFFQRSKDDE